MRYKRPDKKNALSIINAAEREMKFTLSLKLTEESGSTIIRNIYEYFRMVGDAILVLKGISSKNHLAPINELTKLQLKASRPITLIDNLRRLRHNINYYGYKPSLHEVEDAISIAEAIFQPLQKSVRDKLKE